MWVAGRRSETPLWALARRAVPLMAWAGGDDEDDADG
jgi:hypothetical protein